MTNNKTEKDIHKEYHKNKNIKIEFEFSWGYPHWDEYGYDYKYKNGFYKEYYDNKKLKVLGQYRNGHKYGNWIEYDINGNIITEKNETYHKEEPSIFRPDYSYYNDYKKIEFEPREISDEELKEKVQLMKQLGREEKQSLMGYLFCSICESQSHNTEDCPGMG